MKQYFVGLDLGQQIDYTVLTVIDPIIMSFNGRIKPTTHILRTLIRFDLGISYIKMVEEVAKIVKHPLLHKKYIMGVDATGARPAVDMIMEMGLNVIPVTITGGNTVNWDRKTGVKIPKSDLVNNLQVVLQSDRLKIPSDLPNLREFKKELLHFKATFKSDKVAFEAAGDSGVHDDMVLSLCISLWLSETYTKRGRRVQAVGGN